MNFDLFKKSGWMFFDCRTGASHPVEKLPFEIGSSQGVDLRLEPAQDVLGQHAALIPDRSGTMRLTALDPGAGELIINGARREQPFSLETGHDYAIRLGPHLLALRGGRDLAAWRARLDPSRWCLTNPSAPKAPPLGPVSFGELPALAARHGLEPRSLAAHPLGLGAAFWLEQLLPLLGGATSEHAVNGSSEVNSPTPPPSPATPTDAGALTCPVCWLHADVGDLMHIAVHDSLRGDPILGEDAHQRFHATRFNDRGLALDAMGLPATELACPHCRAKLPPGFLDVPHHILSLVGNASAGKSYYLSILAKEIPASVYRHLGLVWQDADPAGNAPLNAMTSRLYGAEDAEEAALEKTVLGGTMYLQVPRRGKNVAMPRPFVFHVSPAGNNDEERRRAESISLIFYDNAGEHFRPDIKLEDSPGALHVAAASGLFFLYDPTTNREFRRRLTGGEDPQLSIRNPDLQDVLLAELKTRIMRTLRLDIGEKITAPLAVIVGKLDAWGHLLGDDRPLFECLDRDGEGLKLDSVKHNSDIVRGLLMELCPTIVANAEAISERVSYFALSAFGHTPLRTGNGGIAPDPARIAPILLEAPTLWMLQQLAPGLVRVAAPTLPAA